MSLELHQEKWQKGDKSIFSKTVFVVTKIFLDLDYGGDNLSHLYTHVFGKKKFDFWRLVL